MKNEALIRAYARPLFDLAVEHRLIEAIAAELKALADLFTQVPILSEYLGSSSVARKDKIELLRQAYGRDWSKFFGNFLDLVMRKGRQEILPDIWVAYRQLWDEHQQKLDVLVTTAVELTDGQRQALTSKLAASTGKKITLKSQVTDDVIGGLRVQIGHKLIDATVANMLANLKQVLLQK